MDLNKHIKEQELIVEEINNEVDNLLNEQAGLILKIIAKIAGAIPKKTYKKAFDYLKDEVASTEEELEKEESETSDTPKDEKLKKIEELLLKLEELEGVTKSLEERKQKTLKYKKVVIDFKKKVSLDIKEMKSPD